MNTNAQSPMQFVLMSVSQLAASKGAGFWNNDTGWVEYKDATQFTLGTTKDCPINPGGSYDAQWLMVEPGQPMNSTMGNGVVPGSSARVRAEAIELLRNATFQDGLGTILTQDAEALEAALCTTGETYVIYSHAEATTCFGEGYWSNEDGWGTLVDATRFSKEERAEFNLPMSNGNDAKWVLACLDEGTSVRVQDQRQPRPAASPAEVILVVLSNGDSAVFVNSEVYYTLESHDKGTSPAELGESLARLLKVPLQTFNIAVPVDPEWTWPEVHELLPTPPVQGVFAPRQINSYADLLAALLELSPEQLAMSVSVSEGCDSNGNAEFFDATHFELAGSDALLAGSDGVLDGEQPVLIFNDPNTGAESDSDLLVSLDGGVTFRPAHDGVRVLYKNVLIPGEDGRGELHINATHEGLIHDVWTARNGEDHNIGTSSNMADDIVSRLVAEND